MTEKLLSIIIPAYNVEKYIEKCLNSVVENKQISIIIINDGSMDNTGEICEEYAGNYNNIKYIKTDNQGLGAARNMGLSLVETPYVCFLDSDDWQDIRFVDKFESLILSLDIIPDMIFTLPVCYNDASKMLEYWMDKEVFESVFDIGRTRGRKIVNVQQCPELYALEVNANRKIYRTQFLKDNSFKFPEGVKWEDIRPHIQLLHEAKNIVAMPETGFYYRTNVNGQITAGTGSGRLDIISVFHDALNYIENSNYLPQEIAQIVAIFCRYSFWMIDMTNMDYIDKLLEGLHGVFLRITENMIQMLENYWSGDTTEKNKMLAFIDFMRQDKYRSLANYEDRYGYYQYWEKNGVKKSTNIISGGIQCIKDSGLKYTIKLAYKKLIQQG